jgi:hypothetical protein
VSDDDRPYWFDAAPLRRSGPLGRLRGRAGGPSPREEFAAANRLAYRDAVAPGDRELPSLLLSDVCKDVVSTTGTTRVEFGNHGWRYWVGDNDFRPSRRGYIAVEHGMACPQMFLESGRFGALTPLNVASAALTFLSIFDNEEGASLGSPVQVFGARSERVEMPEGVGFSARVEKGRLDEARGLLGPRAVPLLHELAGSFDIEIRDRWLLAYSLYGDVSTADPDVWAWAFSAASRMLDLVGVWAAAHGDVAGRWSEVPFYTERRGERPAKLDGALGFLKRPT